MSEELGREPTDEELSEEIGISSAKLSQWKTVSIRPASLDAPISDDNSTEFSELVGDEDAQTPFELFRDKNMRDELSELLEVLNDRERTIILMRFGLDDGKPKTLEEVGKKFGVTRERIRQLQNIALAKLRRALAKREKPTVRRDPIQFLKPVSPDPTRKRLRVAKATIRPASDTRIVCECHVMAMLLSVY
jgi:RNA polymerase primary sigma factor